MFNLLKMLYKLQSINKHVKKILLKVFNCIKEFCLWCKSTCEIFWKLNSHNSQKYRVSVKKGHEMFAFALSDDHLH